MVDAVKQNASVPPANDFYYEKQNFALGGIIITGYKGNNSIVNIPKEIDGKPVKVIGRLAFDDNDRITTVRIPDGVTTIEMGAFRGCDNLKSVSLPDSLTEIGGSAFSGCEKLRDITIPNSVRTIKLGAFYFCEGLQRLAIPDSVSIIGDEAFFACTGLTSITIPDSVKIIGYRAFDACKATISYKGMTYTPNDHGDYEGLSNDGYHVY